MKIRLTFHSKNESIENNLLNRMNIITRNKKKYISRPTSNNIWPLINNA